MKSEKGIEGIRLKDIFFVTLFYSLAFGLMLLNDGIFFDDWVLYHVDKESIMSIASQVGLPWAGPYYIGVLSLNSMIACRIIVFCSYLLAAFFLYEILKKIREISRGERLLVTLFFALFPVNFARITLITSQFSISYFLFFLGLFLLSRYFEKRELFTRISALLVLFISFFSLQSLLVFYGVVIVFIAYEERLNIKTIKGFLFLPLRYLDFLAAPVVFWVMKIIFFKPYGLYTGHNEVNLANLLPAIYKLNEAFNTSFIVPLREALQSLNSNYPMIIILTLLAGIFAYRTYFVRKDDVEADDFLLLLFGFLFFIFGVYGYLAVDKMPTSLEWYSRFQILVPLGASFIIVYFVRIIFNNKAGILVYSLLLVLFTYTNFLGYLNYQKDWFKQLSLMENFKNSEILKNNTSFLFNDKTYDLNAGKRTYYFYEYTGLMKLVFGNERRFGTVNQADFTIIQNYMALAQYNCREYNVQKPQYEVAINYGEYKLGRSNTLKLMLLRLIKPEEFESKVRNIIRLGYTKL